MRAQTKHSVLEQENVCADELQCFEANTRLPGLRRSSQ